MTESQEQAQLLKWFKMQYPSIRYSEHLGGIKLTIGQAKKVKSSGDKRGHPDMVFYKSYADECGNNFNGLAIEFKKTGTKLIKPDGSFYAANKEHHIEQLIYLNELNNQCWFSCFCVGFEAAKQVIEEYVNNLYGSAMNKADNDFFTLCDIYEIE